MADRSPPGFSKPCRSFGRHAFIPTEPEQLHGFKPEFTRLGQKEVFMSSNVFVGIDVSKDSLDIAILPLKEHWQEVNNDDGISRLLNRLQNLKPELVVLEASGGFESMLAGVLFEGGLCVSVVNPRLVRDFAKSLGKLAKTDKIDAEVIALFAERIRPTPRPIPNELEQEFSALLSRRRQIVGMIKAEKNRMGTTNKAISSSLKRHIKWLEKELENTEKALDDMVKTSPIWKANDDILQSVPGVGTVTSHSILAELPELGKVNKKQVASLAGLAPFNCDSGKFRGKRKIWGGRAAIRATIYMATLSAIKYNEIIKTFYQRLCNAGKAKKSAITACMRKLLTILNSMLKNNTPWLKKCSNLA